MSCVTTQMARYIVNHQKGRGSLYDLARDCGRSGTILAGWLDSRDGTQLRKEDCMSYNPSFKLTQEQTDEQDDEGYQLYHITLLATNRDGEWELRTDLGLGRGVYIEGYMIWTQPTTTDKVLAGCQ